jgi:hypothetical protein
MQLIMQRRAVADWHRVLVHTKYSVYEQAKEKGSVLWASGSYACCFGSSPGFPTWSVSLSFYAFAEVLHLPEPAPPSVPLFHPLPFSLRCSPNNLEDAPLTS